MVFNITIYKKIDLIKILLYNINKMTPIINIAINIYMDKREDLVTIAELKTAIRKYKTENCKPFSKLNRSELIDYVKEYQIPLKKKGKYYDVRSKKKQLKEKGIKPKKEKKVKFSPVKPDKPPDMDQPVPEVDVPSVNIPQMKKPVMKRRIIPVKETGTAHLKKDDTDTEDEEEELDEKILKEYNDTKKLIKDNKTIINKHGDFNAMNTRDKLQQSSMYKHLLNTNDYVKDNTNVSFLDAFIDGITFGVEPYKEGFTEIGDDISAQTDEAKIKTYRLVRKRINDLKKKYEKKSVERKKLTREEEAIIKEQERNRREEREDKEREERERNKQKKRNEKEEEERKQRAIKAYEDAQKLKESDRRKKRAMMTQQEKDADAYERRREKADEKRRAKNKKMAGEINSDELEKRKKEQKERESKEKREEAKRQREKAKKEKEKEEVPKQLAEFDTDDEEDDDKVSSIEEKKFYLDIKNNNVFGDGLEEETFNLTLEDVPRLMIRNIKLKTNILEYEEYERGSEQYIKVKEIIIDGRDFVDNAKAKERKDRVKIAKKEIEKIKQDKDERKKFDDILNNNEFFVRPLGGFVKNVKVKDGVLTYDRIEDREIEEQILTKGNWNWIKGKHVLKSGRDAKERKQKSKKEEMKQDEKELKKFNKIVKDNNIKLDKRYTPSDKLFVKNAKLSQKGLFTYEYITASQAKTNKPFKTQTLSVKK